MKLAAISDLHGYLPSIPECDLLLIAGDITPVWDHNRDYQKRWLQGDFNTWLNEVPAKEIVAVGGNHDFVLEGKKGRNFARRSGLRWHFLYNEAIVVEGLKIWGSPLSNRFGNWASMRPEWNLAEIWREIPRDIDILMVHGPAHGWGDLVKRNTFGAEKRGIYRRSEHVGSPSLANQLTYDSWPNLKLFVWGHIHSGYGTYDMPNSVHGINAAYCDDNYQKIQPPLIIDL